jgi:hypothetical protein
LIVPLAIVTALVLIAAWFPFRTLLGQSAQLNAANQQLATLSAQSRAIDAERAAVSSAQATTLLARQEYQLVLPGQRLIQVLTNPTNGALSTGDPGDAPLVSPSNVKDLVPVVPSAPATPGPLGFWSRVASTLEFWR